MGLRRGALLPQVSCKVRAQKLKPVSFPQGLWFELPRITNNASSLFGVI